MTDNNKSTSLTKTEQDEFLRQLDDPESPVSRAVRERATFVKAADDDGPLRKAAAARFVEPAEREASWLLLATRVPPDMKREIEAAAVAAGRTLAAEVRWQLALAAHASSLVEEIERQNEMLAAALDKDWSHEELRKLFTIHRDRQALLSSRLRPARQAQFVPKDR